MKYTIYLNTEINCVKITDGTKNQGFVWDVSNIDVKNGMRLRVFNVAHAGTGHGDNIITFKINDLSYNSCFYYGNDASPPTIFQGTFGTANCYYQPWGELVLNNQTINTITIRVSDDLTNINSGVNTALKFIIGLVIED